MVHVPTYVRIFWWVLLIRESDWLQDQTDHIHTYIHTLTFIHTYVCTYVRTYVHMYVGMIDWLINWFITDQSIDWLIRRYIYTSSVELWDLEVATLCSWTCCTTTERPVLGTQRDTIFVQSVCLSHCNFLTVFCQSVWWIPTNILSQINFKLQHTYIHSINYPLEHSQQSCCMHVHTCVHTYVHRVVLSVLWTCGQAVIGSLWCCTLNAVI